LLKAGCDKQLLACFSDVATADHSCVKGARTESFFTCEDQVLIVK